MKILQVTPSYYPQIGGVETHVFEINQILSKRHQIKTLDFSYIKNKNNKIKIWAEILKNYKLFFWADIVQVHDVWWWIWPLWPFIRHKAYLTFHGWEGVYPIPFKNKLKRFINAKAAKKTIHVGKYIQQFYWDKPDLVIHGGVKNNKKNINYINNKILNIIFLGRLEPENEIDKYLKLLAKFKKNNIKYKIKFVGDGSLKKLAEQYGPVTGYIKNINKYLKNADLVFASSYLSVLEAQSMGKLVCAFYSHKLKESYLKNFITSKYMIIERDVNKMFKKIKSCAALERQLLQVKNGAKALSRKRKSNLFLENTQKFAQAQTWAKIAKQYEKLWAKS